MFNPNCGTSPIKYDFGWQSHSIQMEQSDYKFQCSHVICAIAEHTQEKVRHQITLSVSDHSPINKTTISY